MWEAEGRRKVQMCHGLPLRGVLRSALGLTGRMKGMEMGRQLFIVEFAVLFVPRSTVFRAI